MESLGFACLVNAHVIVQSSRHKRQALHCRQGAAPLFAPRRPAFGSDPRAPPDDVVRRSRVRACRGSGPASSPGKSSTVTDLASHEVDVSLLTPMMTHFVEIKRSLQEYVVLYRVGDFFETFFEDALVLSTACDIALTSKEAGKNLGARVPMAGIPHYTVDDKCRTLLSKGINVAIVDQVEPAAFARPGELVERAITRLMTPGTLVDETMMDTSRSNYLCAVFFPQNANAEFDEFAVALADIGTGELRVTDGLDPLELQKLLRTVQPLEVLIPDNNKDVKSDLRSSRTVSLRKPAAGSDPEFVYKRGHAKDRTAADMVKDAVLLAGVKTINFRPPSEFRMTFCEPILRDRFGVDNVESLGCRGHPSAVCAVGALLNFVSRTLEVDGQGRVPFSSLELFDLDDSLQLDEAALRNLEVVETLRDGPAGKSLRWAVDHTVTAMGARRVRNWLLAPLVDFDAILARQRIVVCLVENPSLRERLREQLRGTADLERLAGRVGGNRASPRELQRLVQSLVRIPELLRLLANFESAEDVPSLDSANLGASNPFTEAVDVLSCGVVIGTSPLGGGEVDSGSLFEIARATVSALVDPAPTSLSAFGGRLDNGLPVWDLSCSNIIRPGYSAELDELRNAESSPSIWLESLEAEEQVRTGLPSMRIKRMKNMGYAFRLPRSLAERKLAEDPSFFSKLGYERSLSTKTEMRFKSQVLQDREREFYAAVAVVQRLEFEQFHALRSRLGLFTDRIRRIASSLAELDALAGFAKVSAERGYVAPELLRTSRLLSLTDSRHPVVEQTLPFEKTYVPNSFELGNVAEEGVRPELRCDQMILCGPNASYVLLQFSGLLALSRGSTVLAN